MKNKFLKTKTLILFIFCSFQIFSQGTINKEFVLKQVIDGSKLIFEGKILSKGESFRATNNAIYTNYSVQLDKSIYGQSVNPIINLVIEGGEIEEGGIGFGTSISDGLSIKLNLQSVIFCKPFNLGKTSNSYLITQQVCYNSKNEIIITNALSEYYKSINDLYKDLSQKLNIQIAEKKKPRCKRKQ